MRSPAWNGSPAFGMAEVAIAGTFPPLMSGLRVDAVDQRVLETERYAAPVDADAPGAKVLARLGHPVPGLEIRVVEPDTGDVCADREVGELEIRGTSVTSGYYKRPEATAATFHDDWLRTGDLAYLIEGELVICGRIKDVIIVAGRNVFPEDVERSVAEIDGVLKSSGVNDDSVTVLSVDCAVHDISRVRRASDVPMGGGGGTDMGVGIEAALGLRPTPQVIVVLTDGATPWPPQPPAQPVIAVVIAGSPPPGGLAPSWATVVSTT